MKKRLLSLLLILCLCAALLSVAVLAEDGVIDVDKTNITNFRGNSNYKYTFPEGSYRLTGDIQLSADGTLIWLVVEGDVTFDLNGHILRATEGKRFQIDVGSSNMDSHLTLTDSQPDVSHEVDGKTINGGMIYGLRGLPGGAGTSCITVNIDSTLTMQGGNIALGKIAGSGNDWPETGGVYVAGTFNMTGGHIIGCSTVSCGGGVAMREVNVQEMRKSGKVILLTAKPETILERVKENHDRPLLENNKTVEYVSELMEKRRPAYEAAADIVIATDGKSANEICEEIIAQVKKFK